MGFISVNMNFSSILSSQQIIGNKHAAHLSPCLKNISGLFFVLFLLLLWLLCFFPVYKSKMLILRIWVILLYIHTYEPYIHLNILFDVSKFA